MYKKACFILVVFCSCLSFSQNKLPTYTPPLKIPLILSGTFGELRSNHFHSGLDIKTQKRIGLPAYAVSSGVVSRISVKHWSYGKALYIEHPDGYTSVYAHLSKFAPEIEKYLKEKQYEKESYEVNLFPDKKLLNIKAGQVVGYTGNSGSSQGPHLHFEIRKTKEQEPMNPMLFGINIKDQSPPTIRGLYLYPLSEDAQIEGLKTTTKINFNRLKNGDYLADPVNAIGKIGIGLDTYDRLSKSYNKNGIYSLQIKINGTPYIHYKFNRFSFKESKYINTLIDYPLFIKNKRRIQKCFITPGNKMSSLYTYIYKNGNFDIVEGMDYQATIEIKDFKGNITTLNIPIKGNKKPLVPIVKKQEVIPNNSTSKDIFPSKEYVFDFKKSRIYLPKEVFFKKEKILMMDNTDHITIHKAVLPIKNAYEIHFDISEYPKDFQSKLFIANHHKNIDSYQYSFIRGEKLVTKTKRLGTFKVMSDTIAPTITAINFRDKQWISNYKFLSFRIKDNLSGIKSYNGYINDQWVLFEYNPKKGVITFSFDDITLNKAENKLSVVVKDNTGNTSKYEVTFFRKN